MSACSEIDLNFEVLYTVEWDEAEEGSERSPVEPDGYVHPYWDDFSRGHSLEVYVYRAQEDPAVQALLRERGEPMLAVLAPEHFTRLVEEAPLRAYLYDAPRRAVPLHFSKGEFVEDVKAGALDTALEGGLIDRQTHSRLTAKLEEFVASAPRL